MGLNREAYMKQFSQHILQQDSFFLLRCSTFDFEDSDEENPQLEDTLQTKSYKVLVKPARKLIALFVPKHIPRLLQLNRNGTLSLLEDERSVSPVKFSEQFAVTDVDQIQHGPSK